jgi:hypothetical protein
MQRFLRLFVILAVVCALDSTAGGAARQRGPILRVTVGGQGLVETANGRIHCRSRCFASYRRGTGIRLMATPEASFRFVGWSGACVGFAPTCLLAVDETMTVGGIFERKKGAMYLTVSGPGSVAIDPGGRVVGGGTYEIPQGLTITLTPHPDAGSLLKGWGGACANAPLDACSFVAAEAHDVAAAFGQDPPPLGMRTLTVEAVSTAIRSTPPGIDCYPVCSATFPAGTVVTLSSSNSDPMVWQGDCGGTAHTCLVALDGDRSVTGAVPPNEGWGMSSALLTVSGPGVVKGSRINCGRGSLGCYAVTYGPPLNLELEAMPARRARFGGWGGYCQGKQRTCRVNDFGSHYVVAFFRRRQR